MACRPTSDTPWLASLRIALASWCIEPNRECWVVLLRNCLDGERLHFGFELRRIAECLIAVGWPFGPTAGTRQTFISEPCASMPGVRCRSWTESVKRDGRERTLPRHRLGQI